MSRNAVLRYAAVAAIVLAVGGLFVQRELLGDEETAPAPASAQGAAVEATPAEVVLGLVDDRELAIGDAAPDFVLEGLDGGLVRLSDFAGRTVVLNFWASWCPPCRAEMPEFEAVYQERLPDDDFTILAIDLLSEDTKAEASRFIEEIGVTFPVAFDTRNGDVAMRYGVRGLPATFFIDRDGVVRSLNLGPVFGDLLPDGIAAADAAGVEAARR